MIAGRILNQRAVLLVLHGDKIVSVLTAPPWKPPIEAKY